MLKFNYEREKAKRITIDMKGDLKEYALNLLNIINNAREYPSIFYKVENNSNNYVYVTYNPKEEESVKEYLENFGEIIKEINVRIYHIEVDYDYKNFDKVYDMDDVDFLIDMD